ncbi:MAG: bifunctional metallophosphatase/5'-nucleotidase [Saprospiraceae bacterium]|nr:bifunctional metallophosphatase/5'-nucleotidase [Saprospiraceae bacterium]
MRSYFTFVAAMLIALLFAACDTARKLSTNPVDDQIIELVFLHINDVYEIAPLENGKVGGMARIATVFQQLQAENPNTLFVHAGDFLNPSLLGTLKFEGQRIQGRQMVEVMNASGVEVVAFGNHEFDLKAKDLLARLDESDFTWICANLRYLENGRPVPFFKEKGGVRYQQPDYYIWEAKDADGTSVKVGIFGATVPANPVDYVQYDDPYRKAQEDYQALLAQTDVVVGLTHLEMIQDLKLAALTPKAPLIMGGHDHDHQIDTVGRTVVAKADANVKSAYIHRLKIDKRSGEVELNSEWLPITDEIEAAPSVEAIVDKWKTIQDNAITQVVEDPYEVVYVTQQPLDGREATIRDHPTNLGTIITESALQASRNAAGASVINSGSVRIDDQLAGKVLAIDVFRCLPFGGALVDVRLKGSLLREVLDAGRANRGTGGYLMYSNIEYTSADKGTWLIEGEPVQGDREYWIVTSDFLLTGLETRLDFFTPDNPGILEIDRPAKGDAGDLRSDIRRAVIDYLKKRR